MSGLNVTSRHPQDSTGRRIAVGDTVIWRGEFYTIKAFGPTVGRFGTASIEFEEPLHRTDEVPDEIGVDLVEIGADEPCAALQNGMTHCRVRDKGVAACTVCKARGL